jgi:hypothetical protein
MKDEILVKPTMATPTNNLIKPTQITRKKPDENASIKPSKVEPVPLASSGDKTASSEDIPALIDAPVTASVAAGAPAVQSEEKNKTDSEVKLVPSMEETTPS